MKVLITGATSFIGYNLAKYIISQGDEVYAFIRPSSKNKDKIISSPKYHKIELDVATLTGEEAPDIDSIDLCIHLAWDGVGAKGRMDSVIQKSNINASLNLAKLVKKYNCKRFIFAGSQAEYGITLEKVENGLIKPDEKIDEEFEALPISEYGKAKLRVLNELKSLCMVLDMDYIHLRIFSTYGYQDHETSLVSCVMKACIFNEKIDLSACKQLWNYIYIKDCVRAIYKLISVAYDEELKKNPIFNIGSFDTKRLYDFALEIADTLQCKKENISFERKVESKEGIPYLNPDISKLEKYTGFKQEYSFREGIKEIEKMYIM